MTQIRYPCGGMEQQLCPDFPPVQPRGEIHNFNPTALAPKPLKATALDRQKLGAGSPPAFPHGYTMCSSSDGYTGGSGQSYGCVTISGRTSGLPMLWKGSGEPSPNFWCPVRSFWGFWGRCGRVKVVYFTHGLYKGSGQSYGSIPITGRTPGLPLVCKGREDPSPYFGGLVLLFLGVWGQVQWG